MYVRRTCKGTCCIIHNIVWINIILKNGGSSLSGLFVFCYLQLSFTADITMYYCNCLVGSRTVGCCAHVMTILWYLSWARFRSVEPPAPFLDDIFYECDDNMDE